MAQRESPISRGMNDSVPQRWLQTEQSRSPLQMAPGGAQKPSARRIDRYGASDSYDGPGREEDQGRSPREAKQHPAMRLGSMAPAGGHVRLIFLCYHKKG